MSLLDRLTKYRAKKLLPATSKGARSSHAVIWQEACERAGIKVDEPLSESEADRLLQAAAGSRVDIEGTVTLAVRRIEWAKTAAGFEDVEAAAQTAERALTEFVNEENERRRLANLKQAELRAAVVRTESAYKAAIAARSELIATAAPCPEETQLANEQTEVCRAIDDCHRKLNRLSGESHIAIANALRSQLEKTKDTANRKELEQRIAHHLDAAAAAEKKLSQLEKRRAEIEARIAELSADKLKPEFFAMVRQPHNEMAVA